MPSIGRKFKTFLTRKMGPKPTERKEIDFSFVPSAHEDFRNQTTRQQMSLNQREMRIDENIARIKFDLLKMRMENGEMLERCNRLDHEVTKDKTSFTSDQMSPLDNQDELDEFNDLLSICSDEEIDPESFFQPNPCRGRLETVTSNENIESFPENQTSTPVTDMSDLNSTASERSPAKDSSVDDSPNRTLERSLYRSPKTIPGSAIHIGVEKSYSENDCPPVLARHSLCLPERPHSSLMDYIHTHSSQRHLAYAKITIPTLTHTSSETIFEKSFSKPPKSFATEVFDEIKKSIGDLSISQTN